MLEEKIQDDNPGEVVVQIVGIQRYGTVRFQVMFSNLPNVKPKELLELLTQYLNVIKQKNEAENN